MRNVNRAVLGLAVAAVVNAGGWAMGQTISKPIDGGFLTVGSGSYNDTTTIPNTNGAPVSSFYNWGPNLIELDNGDMLAVMGRGPAEANSLTGAYMSTKKLGSSNWSTPQRKFDDGSTRGAFIEQNPVLFNAGGGKILAFYRDFTQNEENSHLYMRTSLDNGNDWSDETKIANIAETCSSPIRLANGNLVMGITDKSVGTWTGAAQTMKQGAVLISTDNGASWTSRAIPQADIPNKGSSMATVHEVKDAAGNSKLVAYMRCFTKDRAVDNNEFTWVSESTDGGNTWSTATMTNRPNPNVRMSWTPLDRPDGTPSDQNRIMAYNNMQRYEQSTETGRRRFDVALSKDGGATWNNKILQYDPNLNTNQASATQEHGYPTIIQGSDGYSHLLYGSRPTGNTVTGPLNIVYAKVNADWFSYDGTKPRSNSIVETGDNLRNMVKRGWTQNNGGGTSQNMFFSNTSNAGGGVGEIGGFVTRDTKASFSTTSWSTPRLTTTISRRVGS